MMKTLRLTLTLLIAALLSATPLRPAHAQTVQNQNQATAMMRGYRTGYSDGYQAGVNDQADHAARDFRGKGEYERGDRSYSSNFGKLEDYRDGYQQGYEVGYNAGFDRRPFDSSIPPDLKRRSDDDSGQYPKDQNQRNNGAGQTTGGLSPGGGLVIPRDTVMRIELLGNLSTEASQKGDRFQARVIEPKEFDGATIEGQVTNVRRRGRVKSTAELQLSFDQIRMPDGRSSRLSAQVIEVIPSGGQGVGKVDSEGGVQGKDSTKNDVAKVGAAAGVGAVIGAIAGGGVGAAVGATIGAGVGTAGVLTERGRDINLYQGQQLRIRTAGDAEVQ